jgi:hypothetical protein
MKTKIIFGAGLIIVLAVLGSRAFQGSTAESQTASAPVPAASMTANSPAPDDSTLTTEMPATPAVMPANISPTSPLAQVIRLVDAGVSEDVIMAYVTNSSGTFNLDSDEIIYLSNLGAPNDLVAAMMQHDRQLQSQVAINQNPPPAQPAPAPETVAQPDPQQPVTVNYFYDTLSPYGNWVDVPGYGRCWRPTAVVYDSDWQPYCDRGHWVYTDCGWYWTSDYAWGATFHYGRWFRDSRIGWCWWPDTTWAPSWVTWRYSSDYCGWAPLPPFTTCGSGGFYYRGAAVGVGFNFGLSVNFFTFVPTRNFCDPHPRNYRAGRGQVTQIYNNTTIINNINVNNHTIINHGISPASISSVTHTPVRQVAVHDLRNPGANGNHGANRPVFTGNQNSPRQTGAPVGASGQNPSSIQPSQSAHNPNRPQSQHNDAVNTNPQRPTFGNDARPVTPNTSAQTPQARFNPQAVTPRWQQPQSSGQPQTLDTPRNSTRNPQARPDSDVSPAAPVQPRYVAPPVNYSTPAPSQSAPHNFSQPRNDFQPDQPRQSYSPPPAAPVERQQNFESHQGQNYSAPTPRNDPPAAQPSTGGGSQGGSQRSGGQNQNQNGPPNGSRH